jgi:hypothetical protein
MKIIIAQILICSGVCSAMIINVNGQTSLPTKEETKQDFAIKVGVEEVRLDAVVSD